MYRATDLIVGIDIHRGDNVVQMMNGMGEVIGRYRFRNHGNGTSELLATMAQVMAAHNCDQAHIAGEATGPYWLPLFCQLEQAAPFPLTQYSFNPRVITKFRDGLGEQDKTDVIDAAVTAERLRFGKRLPRPFKMSEQHLALRVATRHRYHLMRELARVKNIAHGVLFVKAPTYTPKPTRPFTDPFGATSQAVLREFDTLDQLAAMPLDELTAWLDTRGRGRFTDPETNARKLQQVAADAFHLPDDLSAVVHAVLTLHLRHIRHLNDLLKRTDHLISTHMQHIDTTLTTIPGIGDVFSAGIIAEIGDLARFEFDEAKVAAYAGLRWSRNQSGDSERQARRLSRQSNHYLRYYLCQAAQSVRMHVPEYRNYYDRKFAEVRVHPHKRAIVLTARKLVRLVVRLLTSHEPFMLKESPRRS